MIKVAVVTCVYKRAPVFELFLKSFLAVKDEVKPDWQLDLFMAGSLEDDEDVKQVVQRFSGKDLPGWATWIEHANLPLGAKWNALLPYAENYDYILVAGSDNVFNAQLFHVYKPLVQAGYDYLGLLSFYIYDVLTNRLLFWPGYQNNRKGEPHGGGRLIHNSIIKANNFKLWDDEKNSSLDLSATTRLSKTARNPKFLHSGPNRIYYVDIKSDVNICPYASFEGQRISPRVLIPLEVYDDLMLLHEEYKLKIMKGEVKIPPRQLIRQRLR